MGGWHFGKLGSGSRTPVRKANMTIVRREPAESQDHRITMAPQGAKELVRLRWVLAFDLRGQDWTSGFLRIPELTLRMLGGQSSNSSVGFFFLL